MYNAKKTTQNKYGTNLTLKDYEYN